MMGPALVAAIAYVDPGNVATNLTAGATSGYRLVWVVVAASLVAILVQYQAAKLGVATGRSLPELCRDRFPRWGRRILWLQAELVVARHRPRRVRRRGDRPAAAVRHAGRRCPRSSPPVVSLLLLALRRRGRTRRFESGDRGGAAARSAPASSTTSSRSGTSPRPASPAGWCPAWTAPSRVLLAMGIVGATVMPHAVYLHSALAQARRPGAARRPRTVRRALR